MFPCFQVIQTVEHDVEATEEVQVVAGVLHVRVVRFNGRKGGEGADDVGGCSRLAAAHVVLAEEELAVEIAGLDGVQVNLRRGEVAMGAVEAGGRREGGRRGGALCL